MKISDLENRPEALNLINIYASFSSKSVKEILQQFSGKGFAQFKESLSDLIVTLFTSSSHKLFNF